MNSYQEVLKKAIRNEDVGFLCYANYQVTPTPSQREIVKNIAFSKYQHQLITSYTQFGKSYCVAMGVGLYVLFNKNKKILIISPTYVQSSIVMNYLAEFIIKSDGLRKLVEFDTIGVERLKKQVTKSRITFKNGCEVRLLSAEGSAKRLMGFGASGLVILDEACLIDYETYRLRISRMLGANKDAIFIEIGNPFDRLNQFYQHYLDPVYHKIHINWQTGLKEGRISQEFVDRQREELLPVEFQVLYDAKFPDDTDDTLFKTAWIEHSQREAPNIKQVPVKILGIDVARMGNDSTIVWEILKFGSLHIVVGKHKFQKQLLTKTRDDVIRVIKSFNPKIINIDSTGVGSGLDDMLKEYIDDNDLSIELNAVIFSESSLDVRDKNKKSEIYRNLAKTFELGNIIILKDSELIKQLSLFKYEFKQDRLYIVDEHMTKSPDEADALAVGCYNPSTHTAMLIGDEFV